MNSVLIDKGYKNFDLIEGNVFDSLEKFINENAESRISLLHLDMDVAEPTEYVLNKLYKRVVKGGLIVIDDYNDVEGATNVMDQFIEQHDLNIETLSFYGKPAFIKKP